jgi:hypothetical protein
MDPECYATKCVEVFYWLPNYISCRGDEKGTRSIKINKRGVKLEARVTTLISINFLTHCRKNIIMKNSLSRKPHEKIIEIKN